MPTSHKYDNAYGWYFCFLLLTSIRLPQRHRQCSNQYSNFMRVTSSRVYNYSDSGTHTHTHIHCRRLYIFAACANCGTFKRTFVFCVSLVSFNVRITTVAKPDIYICSSADQSFVNAMQKCEKNAHSKKWIDRGEPVGTMTAFADVNWHRCLHYHPRPTSLNPAIVTLHTTYNWMEQQAKMITCTWINAH